MENFVVRRATPLDVEAIFRLGRLLTSHPSEDHNRLGSLLSTAAHVVFVAEPPEGEIVGWIHVFTSPRVMAETFAEIGGLVVSNQARKRGVGRALIQAAESWAREEGVSRARIRVNARREGAHAFYERLRYRKVKEQRVYERDL